MDQSKTPAPLSTLATLAAHSFGSATEATAAALALITEQLGVSAAFVARREGAQLRLQQVVDRIGGTLAAGDCLPLHGASREHTSGLGDGLVVGEITSAPWIGHLPAREPAAIRAWACVPLLLSDQSIDSWLGAADRTPRQFQEADVELLIVLARLLCLHIERERATGPGLPVELLQILSSQREMVDALRGETPGLLLADPRQPDQPIVFAGGGFTQLTGYTPEEVIGRNARLLQGPHTDSATTAELGRAIAEHRPVTVEILNYRKDGQPFWNELAIAPIFQANGELALLGGLLKDITPRKQMEVALQQQEQLNQAILNSLTAAIMVLDQAGRIVATNDAWLRLTGEPGCALTYAATPGIDYLALCRRAAERDEARQALDKITALLEAGGPFTFEHGCETAGGTRWFLLNGVPLQAVPGGAVLSYIDITARRATEDALRDSRLRKAAIVESSLDGIIMIDHTGCIVEFNPSAETIFGYRRADVLGQQMGGLIIPGDFQEAHKRSVERFLNTGVGHILGKRLEMTARRADGSIFPVELTVVLMPGGPSPRFIGYVRDISERRRSLEVLYRLSHHDALTSLPNRVLAHDRLSQAIAHARRNERGVGLLLLDLDRFKVINETLGHSIGDLLLQAVAERLLGCLRESDTVARMGGDEFAVVLPDIEQEQDVLLVAQKLRQVLSAPFVVHGQDLFTTCSLGIAVYPHDGDTVLTLLKNADTALYQSKARGGNTYERYTSAMNAAARDRLELENSLRYALQREELEVFYQPQVNLRNGRIEGLEALVRWRHPERGWISPATFIPIAEETGLIIELGEWVLRTACRQARQWLDHGFRLQVAVNFSARQFWQPDLVARIAQALKDTALPPTQLSLEITESSIMRNSEATIGMLRDLAALGVHIAIDDFGTGYSSLSYLRRFPIHTLKIDQSFIRSIVTDGDDAAIVMAVIAMTHSLGMSAIAEGVETTEQMQILRRLGCAGLQGYLFCRPMPAAQIDGLLAEDRRLDVHQRGER